MRRLRSVQPRVGMAARTLRHSEESDVVKIIQVAAVILLLAGSTRVDASSSEVTIVNKSDWQIHQLYLSSVDEEEWGPDQLGEEVIDTDGRFTLQGIPCDDYDVRLVDEDGDECVVGGVALCGDRDKWFITNDDLLACQAETE